MDQTAQNTGEKDPEQPIGPGQSLPDKSQPQIDGKGNGIKSNKKKTASSGQGQSRL